MQTFEGERFGPGNQSVAGRLELSRVGLSFGPADPNAEATIWPMDGALQIRLGGAQDDMIFFSHDEHPGFTVATRDMDVLQDAALAGHPSLPQIRRKKQWLSVSLWVAVAVYLLAGLGFLGALFWFFFW